MITLDPKTTALVLIDLQNGIASLPDLAPRSGTEVVATATPLAEKFRAAGATIVLVNVAFAPDFGDAPGRNVDTPMQIPADGLPPTWSDIVDGLAHPGDLHVTKHQWGAFTGTDLDLQLRRRGIKTLVLGGIATHMGVESTLRHAWELNYDVVVAEDICATFSKDVHDMALAITFPRLSRVTQSTSLTLG